LTIPADQYGFKVGSLRSQAAILYTYGATREYVKLRLGSTQLNVLAELEARGFKIQKTRIRVKGYACPHIQYKIIPKEVRS
jgi:hypothetical protein